MPSPETQTMPATMERRLRWISLAALVVLVPAAIAATGWRDLREIRRTRELDRIEVPKGATAEYDGVKVGLVDVSAIPFEPGLPKDRTFLRTRLVLDPGAMGMKWLDCTLRVTDAAGHAWAAIEPVPDLVRKMLAKPSEPKGTPCTGLAASSANAGGKVYIDGFYLVPRPIPDLHVTMSTPNGRPAYLSFTAEKVQ